MTNEQELAYQVMGWTYAYACIMADKGEDIRKLEVPDLIAQCAHDLPLMRTDQ